MTPAQDEDGDWIVVNNAGKQIAGLFDNEGEARDWIRRQSPAAKVTGWLDMTDDEITAKAKRDYRENGGGAYANPYESGSAGFNAYERGWMQALKQDDKPSFAHKAPAPHEQFRPAVPSKPHVNLYGLAKGRSGPRK